MRKGNLRKMKAQLQECDVVYELPIGEESVALSSYLGSTIRFKYTGKINCIHCGKLTRKSYAQGYCYQCFTSLPQTDEGVLKPEKDLSHLGVSRDMEWAEKNSLIPHFVYLALTDKLKVGVTRHSQVPTRWIDQGATQAIILAKTPNRHIAGVIEVYLKQHFSDKTYWLQMLTQKTLPATDLLEEKQRAASLLHPELQQYVTEDDNITQLKFPILEVPETLENLKLDTTPEIHKQLVGIKGQYLVFSDNTTLNIRNHGGYEVIWED